MASTTATSEDPYTNLGYLGQFKANVIGTYTEVSDNLAFYLTIFFVIILQFFIDQGANLVSQYRKLTPSFFPHLNEHCSTTPLCLTMSHRLWI